MKKKIEIYGRKISVLAVVMAVLIIGSASAALIANYGTLTGTFTVADTITVTGDVSGEPLVLSIGDGAADITITNVGDEESVELFTTVYLGLPEGATPEGALNYVVTDVAGIVMTIDEVSLIGGEGGFGPVTVTAVAGTLTAPGVTTVPVTLIADPALVPGDYTIQIAVNPALTA